MNTIPSKEQLVALYQTKTDDEIALSLAVCAATVRRWRRQHGILSKPRGPRTSQDRLDFATISDQLIREAVTGSFSVTEVCRKVGLCETGQGHLKMKKKLAQLEVDTSHFGSAHPRVLGYLGYQEDLSKLLVKDSKATPTNLKRRLLKEGVFAAFCVNCASPPEWLGHPLTLQLDHINGDTRDNRVVNLRLLCPNCHSQTHTYAGRNKPKREKTNGNEV